MTSGMIVSNSSQCKPDHPQFQRVQLQRRRKNRMRHNVQQLNGYSTHSRCQFNINFLADLVVRSSRTDVSEDAWVHSETAEHIPLTLESARKSIAHSVLPSYINDISITNRALSSLT